jgi:hypothetical protein
MTSKSNNSQQHVKLYNLEFRRLAFPFYRHPLFEPHITLVSLFKLHFLSFFVNYFARMSSASTIGLEGGRNSKRALSTADEPAARRIRPRLSPIEPFFPSRGSSVSNFQNNFLMVHVNHAYSQLTSFTCHSMCKFLARVLFI